jgi:hypothetical protein
VFHLAADEREAAVATFMAERRFERVLMADDERLQRPFRRSNVPSFLSFLAGPAAVEAHALRSHIDSRKSCTTGS